MGKVLYPLTYEEVDGPLIFLAGPVRGARDWQDEAIRVIGLLDPAVSIASPRRPGGIVPGGLNDDEHAEQTAWESFHLERAARQGVILFWLAKEVGHDCHKPYAKTTRIEFGIWVTMHRFRGTQIVVGIEDGFSGARYAKTLIASTARSIPILKNLAETCAEAVERCLDFY